MFKVLSKSIYVLYYYISNANLLFIFEAIVGQIRVI